MNSCQQTNSTPLKFDTNDNILDPYFEESYENLTTSSDSKL